ncbi:MAG: nitrite reductase small subunit NirD, partial [Gammaproteobacteria bacterium]|nr:nitrite reductase small subunit NirD [Gammaproteobacteria bacterium]
MITTAQVAFAGSHSQIPEDPIWVSVCHVDRLVDSVGACALIDGQQVAIFKIVSLSDKRNYQLYALSNYEPHGKAHVLSRGIVGDHKGEPIVASPLYKKQYSLITGQCIDDEQFQIPVYSVKVYN